MDSVVIVDADSIYFRAAFITKKKNEIRKIIDETMLEIEGQGVASQLQVAVKGHGNFRKDVFPAYKKNRKELETDMRHALAYGHEYMKDRWEAVMADGMEADDLVCIWAYEAREMEIPYLIAGIDKDLLQIPGNHYNFKRKDHTFVDDDTASFNLFLQCLTGDSTDNIPGIKGIGPKKGEAILRGVPPRRHWDRVRAAWRGHDAGCPKLSRRLLQMIKTWEEFDGIKTECETLKR